MISGTVEERLVRVVPQAHERVDVAQGTRSLLGPQGDERIAGAHAQVQTGQDVLVHHALLM
jgi:hypothetical protein